MFLSVQMMSLLRRRGWSALLCLVACWLTAEGLQAQTYSQFMKHYEGGDVEYGYGVVESPDGNFTVCGNIGFGPGGSDACLMHLDPGGTQLWTMAYGGPAGEDATAIAVSRDSGYVFVGQTSSFGAGGTDILVSKLDRFGSVQWARAIGGTANEYGTGIDTTSDGGYIVCGYTRSFGAGNNDAYFIKLSAAGAVEWTRVIGGIASDVMYDVVQTSDGGYAGGGYSSNFGAPGNNYYLIRLDAAGNLSNSASYGGPSSDNGFGLIETSDSGLMLYGYTSGFGTGGNEGMLIKTDIDGNLEWARTYGSPAMDRIFHVVELEPGRFVATGETTTNTFGSGDQQVFKVDALGNLVWARHYGTVADETGYGSSVATRDGGIILTGWDDNDEDFLVTKMDSLGDSGCNNALTSLSVTTPALVFGSGGASTSGGTVTNIALPFAANPLTEVPYCAILLPAGEVHLYAVNEGPSNLLRWTILEPEQLAEVSLERSRDGRVFELLQGWNEVMPEQSYRDRTDGEPVNYYRLALVDRDGMLHHSEVKRVLSGDLARTVSWSFAGEKREARRIEGLSPEVAADWQLLDLQGKVLEAGRIEAGENGALSFGNLSQGLYLLRLQQNGRSYASKLWNRR